jgi:hypothetical protein
MMLVAAGGLALNGGIPGPPARMFRAMAANPCGTFERLPQRPELQSDGQRYCSISTKGHEIRDRPGIHLAAALAEVRGHRGRFSAQFAPVACFCGRPCESAGHRLSG